MKITAARLYAQAILLSVFAAIAVVAQETPATLYGNVKDASGKAVSNAVVSVRNAATGRSFDARTDSSGHYKVPNLPAGEYEVSTSIQRSAATSQRINLVPGSQQELNISLSPGQSATTPSEHLPNAPVANKAEPSLEDLGFSPSEAQANARQQALLDKRTHMLKIHQRMGLITTIPMIASVVTSLNAGGRSEGTASRDLHVALGALTGDLYGITAYYAIRAPKISGTETKGPIKVHKILAWIHGPGMIATPILGAIAFEQKNNGQKVHGIAQAHGPVAIVTAGAFGAALLSVSMKF